MILYAKFSNERARAFAIETMIAEERGSRTVIKRALTPESEGHIRRMAENYEALCSLYRKAGFLPNAVRLHGGAAVFEYIDGELLEDTLLAFADKPAAFGRMWKSFFDRIDQTADTVFAMTDGFRDVFGEAAELEGMRASSVSDIDLIPANILERDGAFHVIDYEWTFPFPVPVDFVKWRAAAYFVQKLKENAPAAKEAILRLIPQGSEREAVFERMEEHFQRYMLGNHVPLRLLYRDMTPGSVDMTRLEQWAAAHQTVTVYLDDGEGFREELVRRFPVDPDGYAEIRVPLSGLRGLRIDPTEQPCLVRIGDEVFVRSEEEERAIGEEAKQLLKTVTINGSRIREGVYAFPQPDPWLHVTSWPEGTETLALTLHVETIPEETAAVLGDMLSARSLKARAKQLLKGKK